MTAQRFPQFLLVAVSLLPLALHAESSDLLPPTEVLPPAATAPAAAPAAAPAPAPVSLLPMKATSPAATAPATALPAINVTPPAAAAPEGAPVVGVEAPEEEAAEAPAVVAPVVAPAPPASGKIPGSMKSAKLSLFYTPSQVNAMTEALDAYEKTLSMPAAARPSTPSPIKVEEVKIEEPASYPVFYLSSIAFRASNDWSIWVSGRKITSDKNPTTLKVVSVTPEHVVFSWEPTYKEAIAIRKKRGMFAPLDPVKHRLTKSATYSYNEDTGVITFTLKANQSFTVGYMNTFEGFVASPSLPPLDPQQAAKQAAPATANPTDLSHTGKPVPGAAVDPESEVMELRNPTSVSDSIVAGPDAARKQIDATLKQAETPPPVATVPAAGPPKK